eukprot:NODE_47_length_32105_cov_1.240892.p3 type:complete len:547 gc:universal NODE_47_length_32105_cov_1.240892:25490-23850(-)
MESNGDKMIWITLLFAIPLNLKGLLRAKQPVAEQPITQDETTVTEPSKSFLQLLMELKTVSTTENFKAIQRSYSKGKYNEKKLNENQKKLLEILNSLETLDATEEAFLKASIATPEWLDTWVELGKALKVQDYSKLTPEQLHFIDYMTKPSRTPEMIEFLSTLTTNKEILTPENVKKVMLGIKKGDIRLLSGINAYGLLELITNPENMKEIGLYLASPDLVLDENKIKSENWKKIEAGNRENDLSKLTPEQRKFTELFQRPDAIDIVTDVLIDNWIKKNMPKATLIKKQAKREELKKNEFTQKKVKDVVEAIAYNQLKFITNDNTILKQLNNPEIFKDIESKFANVKDQISPEQTKMQKLLDRIPGLRKAKEFGKKLVEYNFDAINLILEGVDEIKSSTSFKDVAKGTGHVTLGGLKILSQTSTILMKSFFKTIAVKKIWTKFSDGVENIKHRTGIYRGNRPNRNNYHKMDATMNSMNDALDSAGAALDQAGENKPLDLPKGLDAAPITPDKPGILERFGNWITGGKRSPSETIEPRPQNQRMELV